MSRDLKLARTRDVGHGMRAATPAPGLLLPWRGREFPILRECHAPAVSRSTRQCARTLPRHPLSSPLQRGGNFAGCA